MLVDKINPSIVSSYERDVRQQLDFCAQKLEQLMGEGSVQDMMNTFDYAQRVQIVIKDLHCQLENIENTCKPFVDKTSGEKVYGFFEMDEKFIHYALEQKFLTYPNDAEYSYSTISGVAENLEEIHEHIAFLTDQKLDFKRHEKYYKHFGFPTKDFIVWVEESNDYSLFHELIHVGKWGFDLFQSSGFAKVEELKKGNLVRKVDSIPSPINVKTSKTVLNQQNRINNTVQLSQSSEAFQRYVKVRDGLENNAQEKYAQAYKDYRENHPTFFTFTLLATG